MDGKIRRRNGKVHGGTLTLAGWSDTAYGDQPSTGKCRLGYVIGLTPSTLRGPCRIIQWTSKSNRKMVKSSLGGESYAFSGIMDHMSTLREFYGRFLDIRPRMVGFEDCESLFTHRKNKEVITEKFPIRHFLAIRQALGLKELGNVYWLPGLGSPADGLTGKKRDLGPLLQLLESGLYNPGTLRPLRGVAFCEY